MKNLKNQMIYQVFVRNYSKEGTLHALTNDLQRIKDLGADILYLMPIHPIGQKARKGTYGSPYAITDYIGISEDLGTLDDFKDLVKQSHQRGLKVMMDVVFHHSAPDHPWVQTHPHFYHYNDGKLGNKIGDWSDIVDFEFDDNPELIEKFTEVLLYWMALGVDGFRFDVASMIPEAFYAYAFDKLKQVNPHVILFAESLESHFVDFLRLNNYPCLSDSELYAYFDILYDYDIYHEFWGYLRRGEALELYREAHRRQERAYPAGYVKARHVENHDNPRILYVTQNRQKQLNWMAYSFFAKGIAFLHAGVETHSDHMSYLFEKDPVDWSLMDEDLIMWIKALAKMKQDPIFAQDYGYSIHTHPQEVLHFEYENEFERRIGIFNVGQAEGVMEINVPEGLYQHDITQKPIEVRFNILQLSKEPIIFTIKKS